MGQEDELTDHLSCKCSVHFKYIVHLNAQFKNYALKLCMCTYNTG